MPIIEPGSWLNPENRPDWSAFSSAGRFAIPLEGGASYTLDPFAGTELGGSDPDIAGMARYVTVPEPTVFALTVSAAFIAFRRRHPHEYRCH